MDNTQPELFDGDIGPVRYTFNVPGLSFEHYCKGSAITMQPLEAPRSIFQSINNLIIWLVIAIGVMFSIQIVTERSDRTILGVYLFLFALLFLFPIIMGVISSKRRTKKLYSDIASCLNGYTLVLGEKGLKSVTTKGIVIYPWLAVSDLASHKGIDYIAIYPNGFLWIPEDLEGYNSIEVSAFILQRMAAEPDIAA
ncbi:hypothetical protein [Budvicia aquatica]|uniref:hypothetical protein n=1 Tax=Budvicia aquatica TaxID=82979 RepID=UPI00207FC467|nr:hypothetical protein [Budvicia aquatica]GKX53403.1 hypothetical protein SOASR029_37120 [Budvicia aquatica]